MYERQDGVFLGNIVYKKQYGRMVVFEQLHLDTGIHSDMYYVEGDKVVDVEEYDHCAKQPGCHRLPTQQESNVIAKMIQMMGEV